MDDLIGEIGKGFFRGIGYILAEVLFNFVFYYIGWPFCKLITFGRYPKPYNTDYLHTDARQGLLCSIVGMVVCILIGLYFAGQF